MTQVEPQIFRNKEWPYNDTEEYMPAKPQLRTSVNERVTLMEDQSLIPVAEISL